MNYNYNDFVICNASFGKIIAKFLLYRPDKKTILVDYEGNIYQFPPKEVKNASKYEIEKYFQQKINYQQNNINKTLNDLNSCRDLIKNRKSLLKRNSKTENKLMAEFDGLKVIIKINESNNKSNTELNIKSLEVERQLNSVRLSMRECSNSIYSSKVDINYLKDRLKLFKDIKKKWEIERDKWLGGLNNETNKTKDRTGIKSTC